MYTLVYSHFAPAHISRVSKSHATAGSPLPILESSLTCVPLLRLPFTTPSDIPPLRIPVAIILRIVVLTVLPLLLQPSALQWLVVFIGQALALISAMKPPEDLTR